MCELYQIVRDRRDERRLCSSTAVIVCNLLGRNPDWQLGLGILSDNINLTADLVSGAAWVGTFRSGCITDCFRLAFPRRKIAVMDRRSHISSSYRHLDRDILILTQIMVESIFITL